MADITDRNEIVCLIRTIPRGRTHTISRFKVARQIGTEESFEITPFGFANFMTCIGASNAADFMYGYLLGKKHAGIERRAAGKS